MTQWNKCRERASKLHKDIVLMDSNARTSGTKLIRILRQKKLWRAFPDVSSYTKKKILTCNHVTVINGEMTSVKIKNL